MGCWRIWVAAEYEKLVVATVGGWRVTLDMNGEWNWSVSDRMRA